MFILVPTDKLKYTNLFSTINNIVVIQYLIIANYK